MKSQGRATASEDGEGAHIVANKGIKDCIPYQFTKQTAKAAGSKAGKASGKVRARQALQRKQFRYLELYAAMKQAEGDYNAAVNALESAKTDYLKSCEAFVAKYGEQP